MTQQWRVVATWLMAPPNPNPNPGGGGVSIPDPPAKPIPGAQSILDIISYIKWGALVAIVAAFFGGLIAFTAGRLVDNRRAGNVGALMMISALGGAILYGIGYLLIRSFTHT